MVKVVVTYQVEYEKEVEIPLIEGMEKDKKYKVYSNDLKEVLIAEAIIDNNYEEIMEVEIPENEQLKYKVGSFQINSITL